MNPYRFPDDRHRVINFSGGRSSAFLLANIVDAYGGTLPANVAVCFANTGKEREETLDFVEACGRHFGVDVVWLEYRYRENAAGGKKDLRHIHVVVDHARASRNGEPFEQSVKARKMLPTVAMRFCTRDLKVNTVDRYMARDRGVHRKDFTNVLGIRYDEPRRWSKALFGECQTEYPMVHAKATLQDVMAFWEGMPFDLGLHPDQSNCDLCFLKGRGKLVNLIRIAPGRAQWWVDMETAAVPDGRRRKLVKEAQARFRNRESYLDLVEMARTEPEQMSFPELEDQSISCFCGD